MLNYCIFSNVFLFVITCSLFLILCLSNIPFAAWHNNCLSLRFVFMPASFGSRNVAPASFPINNITKGRWTQEEHKIFMQEYEKYGNNCMKIAKVFSTWTPSQIKKHAECFFKQNLKTNSAAVKRYQKSLSCNGKAQVFGQTCLWTTKILTISFIWR